MPSSGWELKQSARDTKREDGKAALRVTITLIDPRHTMHRAGDFDGPVEVIISQRAGSQKS